MYVPLQAASVAAFLAASLGRFSTPAPPVPICVCRFDGHPESEAGVVAVTPSQFDISFGRDTTPPALFILLGIVLGFAFAVALARIWRALVNTLCNALQPEQQYQPLRRPRAIAL